ncbi:mitochondrial carrier domain-containing protein [Entophlyctis helioformis]|nr:mitochondrial carrier domain-containing protein [Entophlyctis helioformis]
MPAAKTTAVAIPIPSVDQFIAGGLAGVAQVLVGHPLDTVKTRLQLGGAEFKGPMDCIVKTARHEGILGLYKGMAAPLVGVAFVNAVLFSAYGWCRNIQTADSQTVHQLSLSQIALAGAGGGIIQSFVAGPIELLKIRLQMQRAGKGAAAQYGGPLDVVRQLVRDHGIRHGLFRGTTSTIIKEIPVRARPALRSAYAGYYVGFEAVKRWLSGTPNESPTDLPVHQLMFAGAIGGLSYWTACYPLDVAKSRIQRSNRGEVSANIFKALGVIYREAGWRGWFKGYATSLARSIPSAGELLCICGSRRGLYLTRACCFTAATFTVYEVTMRFMSS